MRDSEFIRGTIPMTKEEVRAIVLNKLELQPTDSLMDIGAGSGSISIEAAKILTKGKVIAIDREEKAIELIRLNAQKHMVANLEVRQLAAPAGMEDVNNVNKIFIGGSGGNLPDILNQIDKEISTDTRIVQTAIVLDTLITAYQFFKSRSYHLEITQVNVNKIDMDKKLPMFFAQNPIFILTAQKK